MTADLFPFAFYPSVCAQMWAPARIPLAKTHACFALLALPGICLRRCFPHLAHLRAVKQAVGNARAFAISGFLVPCFPFRFFLASVRKFAGMHHFGAIRKFGTFGLPRYVITASGLPTQFRNKGLWLGDRGCDWHRPVERGMCEVDPMPATKDALKERGPSLGTIPSSFGHAKRWRAGHASGSGALGSTPLRVERLENSASTRLCGVHPLGRQMICRAPLCAKR